MAVVSVVGGVAEPGGNGIGSLNESSLHRDVKAWYAQPGDLLEAQVDGYVIDLVRGDLLVEVQTGSFASIRGKLGDLLTDHPVRLVYPLPVRRWITRVSPETGEILGRRRSPKRGRAIDVFDELVRIPELMADPGFSLEVLLIEQDEIRCVDGQGSWRRGGASVVDRRLLRVVESVEFCEPACLARLLPEGISRPFTNRMLAAEAAVPLRLAQRMTYCLRRMGRLVSVGRTGRQMLFDAATQPEAQLAAAQRVE